MVLNKLNGKIYFDESDSITTEGIDKYTEGCVLIEGEGIIDIIFGGSYWLLKSNGGEFKFSNYTKNITLSQGAGTLLSCTKKFSADGVKVCLTAEISDEDIYSTLVVGVTGDTSHDTVEVTNVSGTNEYYFTMPNEAVTITTSATAISRTVTLPESTTGGTVSASSLSGVYGDTITLTLSPSTGYAVDTVTASDSSGAVTVSGSGNTRTFKIGTSNVTVSASFVKIDYAITVSTTENGSITVDSLANYNDTVEIVGVPDDGYILHSVTVTKDGGTVTTSEIVDNACTFTMPAEAVTITAVFSAEQVEEPPAPNDNESQGT